MLRTFCALKTSAVTSLFPKKSRWSSLNTTTITTIIIIITTTTIIITTITTTIITITRDRGPRADCSFVGSGDSGAVSDRVIALEEAFERTPVYDRAVERGYDGHHPSVRWATIDRIDQEERRTERAPAGCRHFD
jgi:hypothetical protein